ncbi:hypothetical protein NSQ45_04285 [Caldifermentibacillus hisashii]
MSDGGETIKYDIQCTNTDDCDGDFFGLRDNQMRRLVYECH